MIKSVLLAVPWNRMIGYIFIYYKITTHFHFIQLLIYQMSNSIKIHMHTRNGSPLEKKNWLYCSWEEEWIFIMLPADFLPRVVLFLISFLSVISWIAGSTKNSDLPLQIQPPSSRMKPFWQPQVYPPSLLLHSSVQQFSPKHSFSSGTQSPVHIYKTH